MTWYGGDVLPTAHDCPQKIKKEIFSKMPAKAAQNVMSQVS